MAGGHRDRLFNLLEGLVRVSEHVVAGDHEPVLLADADKLDDVVPFEVPLVRGVLPDDPLGSGLEREHDLSEACLNERLEHLAVGPVVPEKMDHVHPVDVEDVDPRPLNLSEQSHRALLVTEQGVVLDEDLLDP